ncbi:hypothetical protein [Mesobacillus jeotgali]|uniref:hypothetical protein n=1 Tax=Mesobacillus jeotgali TaxID=129985 RepID=UPI0009A794C8|nr:hypothetical protein [Mesobacillus jeotgali]
MKRNDKTGDLSDLFCDENINKVPFPRIKVIPVRDVPDDCVLVCVWPFCFLACNGAGEDPWEDCEIVCNESGQCFIVCPVIPDGD